MVNSNQAPTQKEGRARIRRVVIEERQRKTLEHVRLPTGYAEDLASAPATPSGWSVDVRLRFVNARPGQSRPR